jgi:hypothetical protein
LILILNVFITMCKFSEQMAMCAPNPDSCGGTGKCEGSTAELAFEYLTGSKGMYQEYQYSYASYYGERQLHVFALSVLVEDFPAQAGFLGRDRKCVCLFLQPCFLAVTVYFTCTLLPRL